MKTAMQPIPMVDLVSQYQKIKPEIDQAIQSVVDSVRFVMTLTVMQFENYPIKHLNVKHVIDCANGMDVLMALKWKSGNSPLYLLL